MSELQNIVKVLRLDGVWQRHQEKPEMIITCRARHGFVNLRGYPGMGSPGMGRGLTWDTRRKPTPKVVGSAGFLH